MNKGDKPVIGGHRAEAAAKAAEAQKNAIRDIGSPGMVGVGPGQNLQQKTLQGVQKDFKVVLEFIKKKPRPDEASVKGFIDQLKHLNGSVAKLKAAVPGLEQNYQQALSALQQAEAAFKPTKDDAKLSREILLARNNLQKIVDAQIG